MSEVDIVKAIYSVINGGDFSQVAKYLDPHIVRVEPEGFPASGIYRGFEAVIDHFMSSRNTWAEGACTAERTVVSGDKVVAFVGVRVRLKDRQDWIIGNVTDVFTFKGGKVIEMRSFIDAQQALQWAGAKGV